MTVVAFKEKSRVLAEQYGWSLASAKGYVDGETFRTRHKAPPVHAVVGIDEYSEGFRAGYFRRPLSEHALSGEPSAQSRGLSSFASAPHRNTNDLQGVRVGLDISFSAQSPARYPEVG
jgi:hypothetical protein